MRLRCRRSVRAARRWPDIRAQLIRLWTLLLAGFMVPLLDGCVAAPDENQPLSPILIRDRLSARTLSGSENGNGFLLRLEPNGVARVNGATAEFGHWRATENGLYLTWHDGAERCAPVRLRSLWCRHYGAEYAGDLRSPAHGGAG